MSLDAFALAKQRFFRYTEKMNLDGCHPGQNMPEHLTEPDRSVESHISLKREDGTILVCRGYRVQFNDDRGPDKGGIRCHRVVDLAEEKALAFWLYLETAVVDIPRRGPGRRHRQLFRMGAEPPGVLLDGREGGRGAAPGHGPGQPRGLRRGCPAPLLPARGRPTAWPSSVSPPPRRRGECNDSGVLFRPRPRLAWVPGFGALDYSISASSVDAGELRGNPS